MTIKERESGGPFWPEVDEIFAGIDDSWDFFQQDVEEFGFDSPPFDQEAGSEQAADPIVD